MTTMKRRYNTRSVSRRQTRPQTPEREGLQVSHQINTCTLSVNGVRKQIRQQSYHTIGINGHMGVLRIKNIWKECGQIYVRGTLFIKPTLKDVTHKDEQQHGEDEVIEYHRQLVLSKQELEDLCSSSSELDVGGTKSFTMNDLQSERINLQEYVKLLSPKYSLGSNVSATIERKLLGPLGSNKKKNSSLKHAVENERLTSSATEESCHVLVLITYDEYCHVRKLKAALETGLPISKGEAIKSHVVARQPKRILFTREISSSKIIEQYNRRMFHLERGVTKPNASLQGKDQDIIDDKMYHKFKHFPTKMMEEKLTKVKSRRVN